MTDTDRPASGGTDTGRETTEEQRGSSSHLHPNTAQPATQDRGACVSRTDYPNLTDDQWAEREFVLRQFAQRRQQQQEQVPFAPWKRSAPVVNFTQRLLSNTTRRRRE